MPRQDAQEALSDYVEPLQAALHCLTPVKLRLRHAELDVSGLLNFEQSPNIELRRRIQVSGQRLEPVYFGVAHRYRIIRDPSDAMSDLYRVIAGGYQYTISNHHQREVITYHWHPGQRSREHGPHVHIGSAVIDSDSSDIGKTFSRFHIPTGYISIAQVVRLMLTDFNVVPNRQDWQAVLAGLLPADRQLNV